MSEDTFGVEPPKPPRAAPRPPDLEPDDVGYEGYGPEPQIPQSVKIAGVLWIIYGCLLLLAVVGNLVLGLGAAGAAGQAGPGGQAAGTAFAAGAFCGVVFVGLFAAAFLFVGVQSLRGTAKDTMGNGVGSIIFSVLQFGWAAVALAFSAAQPVNLVQAGIAMLTGALLLTAGILALTGRGAYREWKKAELARWQREAAERRARRRPYQ